MITKTNQDILNFLTDFHIATSGQIYRLFFKSYRYCMKELNKMLREGHIKRTISTINNCHAYYVDKKPAQIHHDLIRSELFVNLRERFKITAWNNEMPVLNIRPDALAFLSAFAFINDHDIEFPVFIEIHLSNKFNFDKYKDISADFKSLFGIMPRVIICTDRQVTVPNIGIRFKVIGLDMSGLDTLLK